MLLLAPGPDPPLSRGLIGLGRALKRGAAPPSTRSCWFRLVARSLPELSLVERSGEGWGRVGAKTTKGGGQRAAGGGDRVSWCSGQAAHPDLPAPLQMKCEHCTRKVGSARSGRGGVRVRGRGREEPTLAEPGASGASGAWQLRAPLLPRRR